VVPLVYQARDWASGVYLAATLGSETTAAAAGAVGQVRRDPFAMLPFCGYHMGDYFRYWLAFGSRLKSPPLIFGVNWFRIGADGKFLWPGYGENMRALAWIVARTQGSPSGAESPLGTVPRYRDLNWKGLEGFTPDLYRAVTSLDRDLWKTELLSHDELFAKLGDKLPAELLIRRKELESEIDKMPAQWNVPD
jgi:phosphoenolpyruvate carboxykinase (GTP)